MHKPYLSVTEDGPVAVVTLSRPEKRNAIDEASVNEIEAWFSNIPPHIRVVLMKAEGDHFCAGLDLREHHDKARSGVEFMRVCQGWHRAFDRIQHSGVPVVAVMQGAV